MPTYQYLDKERGMVVELQMPVAERDAVPAGLTRITVPQTIRVVGLGDPQEAEQAVPVALRKLEDKQNARAIAKDAGFSVRELKEIWKL